MWRYTAQLMTRKDLEKDSERPHYYSQFWLDVAAGRRIIGAPKPNDENDQGDIELSEPITSHRAGRMNGVHEESFSAQVASNGHSEIIEHPIADPIVEDEEIIEPEVNDLVVDEEQDDFAGDELEDSDAPDMDLTPIDDEDEDLEEDAEEGEEGEEGEEEEDEDDIGWSGRGRKRNKPARVVKPVARKPKREPRRY